MLVQALQCAKCSTKVLAVTLDLQALGRSIFSSRARELQGTHQVSVPPNQHPRHSVALLGRRWHWLGSDGAEWDRGREGGWVPGRRK